jgi:peptide/nickel transport system ATP-binding protein
MMTTDSEELSVAEDGTGDAGPEDILLSVDGLAITVPSEFGPSVAVRGASFRVRRAEAVGLVGESGSGKTLTCRAVLGVLPPGCTVTAGSIHLHGQDLGSLRPKQWQKIHGSKIGAIFQDPASYLNPSIAVGKQLAEVLRVKGGLGRKAAKVRAIELMEAIGLQHPRFVYHQIPSELSGGMLQRIMIAIAIACEPELIVADEATTALDVVTQAEVLNLLKELRTRLGISVLFVSHDLAVVAELCDRIVFFYAGEVVEVGEKHAMVGRPLHPYTEALLRVGSPKSRTGELESIPGQPPAVGTRLPGCRFADRCSYAEDRCIDDPVPLRELSADRWVRCIRADELALVGGDLVDV